ncbi:MAG: T9SS type A sorting domain-containing protein [Bacteroidaceae bacterium]|nr:T9SS type A sorting domain-containing protein [Bacteroidaceae bacterium]
MNIIIVFFVFIDWNQNNMLDDEGEVYEIEDKLFSSTGTDDKQIIADIVVPADAEIGTTRMRVKKTFNASLNNPCSAEDGWGQAEDYTIEVTEGSGVSVTEHALSGFSYFPNPSSGMLQLQSVKNMESVSLYNLVGQEVFTAKVNAASSTIDVSHLSAGTYIMKVFANGEMGTYKFMKK